MINEIKLNENQLADARRLERVKKQIRDLEAEELKLIDSFREIAGDKNARLVDGNRELRVLVNRFKVSVLDSGLVRGRNPQVYKACCVRQIRVIVSIAKRE